MLRPSLLLTLVAATIGLTGTAVAQQQQPKAAPQPKAPPQQVQPKTDAAPPPSADAGLRLRVEQLEEQLVDMQVVIGTLESLARGGGGGNAAGAAAGRAPMSAADAQRMEQLESQVRQLKTQVEQMGEQLRTLGGSGSSSGNMAEAQRPRTTPAPRGSFDTQVTPQAPQGGAADRDPIGQIIGNQSAPRQPAIPAPIPGQATEPTPSFPQAQASDASSKQLYETAYGLLLQQDYAAAEAAFEEFLRRYPNDQLAGNAQYWLGETHYVRGQFKPAATAFLKGYQTYARSSKAPDSLLKLAMSLDRLGQRDAACSSYSELTIKFPNAPGAVKNRADNERRRLGCQ